jgi:hypothetical protein
MDQRAKLTQDDGHMSYSQLTEFAGCPRKYYHHRVAKVLAKPAFALVSGKALHVGLETHNKELIRGTHTSVKDIIDAGAEHIRGTPEGDDLEIPRGRAIDLFVTEAKPTAGEYLKSAEPEILKQEIIGIEEEIKFSLGGVPFLGYIDLRTTDTVLDYKLISRRKSAKEVASDPQLILYRQHFNAKAGGLVCLLRERAVAEIVMQDTTPAIVNGVLDWAASIVLGIQAARINGVWPRCDPRAWQCGPICAYYGICFKE